MGNRLFVALLLGADVAEFEVGLTQQGRVGPGFDQLLEAAGGRGRPAEFLFDSAEQQHDLAIESEVRQQGLEFAEGEFPAAAKPVVACPVEAEIAIVRGQFQCAGQGFRGFQVVVRLAETSCQLHPRRPERGFDLDRAPEPLGRGLVAPLVVVEQPGLEQEPDIVRAQVQGLLVPHGGFRPPAHALQRRRQRPLRRGALGIVADRLPEPFFSGLERVRRQRDAPEQQLGADAGR